MQWHVYIVECKDKSLYTGISNDTVRRLQEHRSGKGGYYTRTYGVNNVLYTETFCIKREALAREAQIKRWSRKKKLALIAGDMVLLKAS